MKITAPVSPRCLEMPGASPHETERLRAENVTQRLWIEELEAELASLRGRIATAQQQLPTTEESTDQDGGAHEAGGEDSSR